MLNIWLLQLSRSWWDYYKLTLYKCAMWVGKLVYPKWWNPTTNGGFFFFFYKKKDFNYG